MDLKLKLILFLLDLVAPLAVGYVLFRTGWMSRSFSDRVIRVSIVGVTPILVLLAGWALHLDMVLIWLPILGVVMQAVPGAAGYFMARRKYDDKLDQGGYVLSAMLQNRAIVGGLSVYILFGEQGYAWSHMVMALAPLVVFGFCMPLAGWFRATHTGDVNGRTTIWSVIFSTNQLPVLGLAVGMTLQACDVTRPQPLAHAVPYLVHALAWTRILPLGFDIDLREMRRYLGHLVELMGIKFILTPVIIVAVGYALGLRGDMLGAVSVLAAAPTAMNAVVLSRINHLNIHLTMAAFVFTTMVYMALVFPLLLWWFGR